MQWWEWLLVGAGALLFSYRSWASRIPPTWWYLSRRNRVAMRLALQAAAQAGLKIDWSGCRIVRSDREKGFVLVQDSPPFGSAPEGYRMYVVRTVTGQIDDLGHWVFHWGIFPSHAIETYEACRAAGRPWPNGFQEWVRFWE
jgi:hypothetical protein